MAGANWVLIRQTPTERVFMLDIGDGKSIMRTETVAEEALLEMNSAQRDANDGQRWGDGKVVARVPMHKFMAELGDGIKTGDRDHLKWWVNNPDNAMYRTKRGTI